MNFKSMSMRLSQSDQVISLEPLADDIIISFRSMSKFEMHPIFEYSFYSIYIGKY